MENDQNDNTFEIIESQDKLPRRLRRTEDGFSRMDVVNAFSNAFQMMGGVNRLALWANANPDKFYPLYAKLMPSTAVNIVGDNARIIIEHSIPATPLDEHPDVGNQN